MNFRIIVLLVLLSIMGCRAAPHRNVVEHWPEPPSSEYSDKLTTERQMAHSHLSHHSEPGRSFVSQVSFQSESESQVVGTADLMEVASDVVSVSMLEEIEMRAIQIQPAIAQLEAELEALRGKHVQAGLAPNPRAGINGEDIGQDGNAGRFGVYYGQEIVRGKKLQWSQSVVCAQIDVAEKRLAAMKQRVSTDVRLRYYELLVAQRKVELVEQLVALSRNANEVSMKLFEAQEVSRAVTVQSNLELKNALTIQVQSKNEVTAARQKLGALIDSTELPYEQVEGTLEEAIEALEFESTFETLLANSPELAELNCSIEQARRNVGRQIVDPIPNVTWQTTLQYDTANDDLVSGFLVGMPIPIRDQNQGAIHQAQFEFVSAQRKLERKVLGLRSRLSDAFREYESSRSQLEIYKEELLPLAEESLELLTAGYEQGEVEFLQLLTAQRTYFQTNIDYINRLRRYWQQSVRIRGMLLEGSIE